jgi:ADP-heptose:LPS heptosyltransferase
VNQRPHKILLQRCDKLGDTVLILPMVAALRELYPSAEIHALTSPVGAEILRLHPDIHTVHRYKVGSGITSLWKFSRTLKAENYTLYISIWNHPEMAWLGLLAGIPLRIGDASNPSLRWLYTHSVRQNWANMTTHWSSFNLSLLSPLVKQYRQNLAATSTPNTALTTKSWPPKYPISVGVHGNPSIEHRIDITAGDRDRDPRIRVAIFVGTGGTNFPIPESAILRFITLLTQNKQYRILLCGEEATPALMSLTQENVTNLIGKTNLPELIAWIRQSDIYVGPDTGPTQIASMMGKPIVFFSPVKPNPPAYWGPLSPAFRIIREEYTCPRFCATDGCRSSCFDFLTGDRLYAELCSLHKQMHPHLMWTPAESASVRFQHTLRILIVCHSVTEWEIANHTREALAKQDVQSWVLYSKTASLKDAFLLVKIIKARNINVIHGPFLPGIVMRLVRLIMGVWYKYPSPLWVKSGILPETSLKQLMSLYRKLWA